MDSGSDGVAADLPVDAAWAPGDACTLPTAQRPLRVAEFEQLFASSLIGLDRLEPGWLRLRLDPSGDTERRARELVARESECCSFFDFDVHREVGEVVLDVRVPQNHVPVLDGLGRQAEIRAERSVRLSPRPGAESRRDRAPG